MNLDFIERIPTPEEYNIIRKSVGWGTYDTQILNESLPKSLYSVCCETNGKFIAMGRVVGDYKLCFYIQDIIVEPAFQGKRIGTKIMNFIMMDG